MSASGHGHALTDEEDLLLEVVSVLGFSATIGPGLVQRALADVGVEAAEASAADYRRAFPEIAARVRAYLPEGADGPLDALRALLDRREDG